MKLLRRTLNWIALFTAVFSILAFKKNKAPRGVYLMASKLLAGVLEPFFGIAGLICAVIGIITKARLALFAGMFSFLATIKYLTATISLPRTRPYVVMRVFIAKSFVIVEGRLILMTIA